MSKYLGDYVEDATIDFMFSTFSPVTSAPAALVTGAAQVYKANNLGQTSTGVTLTADFDGITGQNHVRIDTSDSFYATGNDYNVVISGGTVSGVAVTGTVLATFSIENRNNRADLRKIDGTALSAATLNLKKLNVVNSSGDAAVFESTGSNGRGVYVQGHGTGTGAYVHGGATSGIGAHIQGAATGHGLFVEAGDGEGSCGLVAYAYPGSEGDGIRAVGDAADIEGKLGSDALEAVSATALARFATVDTGQVSASDGSVAKLAQGSGSSAASIADAVLDEALSGHATSGSLGAAISSILTHVSSGTISISTPNLDDSEIEFVQGDDVTIPISLDVSGHNGSSLTGCSLVFSYLLKASYDAETGTATSVSCSAPSISGGTLSSTITLTNAQTADLSTSPGDDPLNYVYELTATTTDNKVYTLAQGAMTVKRQVA